MAKKCYNILQKQQADLKALLRGAVCAYLLWLAWKLGTGGDAGLPAAARLLAGGLFAVGAVLFGWFAWKQYRAALKEAELPSGEEGEPKD